MFINICSLSKTKNKAKAVVALEADMCPNDVNQCACGNGNAPQTTGGPSSSCEMIILRNNGQQKFFLGSLSEGA